jgi:hypothetical protein
MKTLDRFVAQKKMTASYASFCRSVLGIRVAPLFGVKRTLIAKRLPSRRTSAPGTCDLRFSDLFSRRLLIHSASGDCRAK